MWRGFVIKVAMYKVVMKVVMKVVYKVYNTRGFARVWQSQTPCVERLCFDYEYV